MVGEMYMIKAINKLNIIYDGDLIIDDDTSKNIKEVWNNFIKDKNPNDYYDGDIYCVTNISLENLSMNVSKTKFSSLIYAKKTNNLIIRSLFSAGYIRTIDNYICIILNKRNILNTIGGMADNIDFKDNQFDCEGCLIREVEEELGINLMNNNDFEVILKYLKYPSEVELNESYYPVGTLYEIKTKYTKEELIDLYLKTKHDSEVKDLKFYDKCNYKEVYSYDNKEEYLDELFKLLFD